MCVRDPSIPVARVRASRARGAVARLSRGTPPCREPWMVPGFIFLGSQAADWRGDAPEGSREASTTRVDLPGYAPIVLQRPCRSVRDDASRVVVAHPRAVLGFAVPRGRHRRSTAPEDGAHLISVCFRSNSPDLRSSLTRLDSTAQADARDQGVLHHRQAQGRQEREDQEGWHQDQVQGSAAPSTSTPWWLTTSTRRTSSSSPCPRPRPGEHLNVFRRRRCSLGFC